MRQRIDDDAHCKKGSPYRISMGIFRHCQSCSQAKQKRKTQSPKLNVSNADMVLIAIKETPNSLIRSASLLQIHTYYFNLWM